MKRQTTILLLVILTSCTNESTNHSSTNTLTTTFNDEDKKNNSDLAIEYPEMILKENSIDSFPLPFPEKEMLFSLRKYYPKFRVERKIGQQDGPDFEYIDIRKQDTTVLFFSFDPDNKYLLNEIIIKNSLVVDEYGLRVGDNYSEIKKKRKENFKNGTDYHAHTQVYAGNSNIRYEITGTLILSDTVDITEVELTDKELQNWKIEYIIWRKE